MNNNSNTGAHHHTPPEKKATLPRHPNAKGGLPGEMPGLPAELERGVSSLSLLRGLSSGFDPNLSLGFSSRGLSTTFNGNSGNTTTSSPSKDNQQQQHDSNDPMLSRFDRKFFSTLINETSSGDGATAAVPTDGDGTGPRVASTSEGRVVGVTATENDDG